MNNLDYIKTIFDDFPKPDYIEYKTELDEISNQIYSVSKELENLETATKQEFIIPIGKLVGYKERLANIKANLNKTVDIYKVCLNVSEQNCVKLYSKYVNLKQDIQITCFMLYLAVFIVVAMVWITYKSPDGNYGYITSNFELLFLYISVVLILLALIGHLIYLKMKFKTLFKKTKFNDHNKENISKVKELYLAEYTKNVDGIIDSLDSKTTELNALLNIK